MTKRIKTRPLAVVHTPLTDEQRAALAERNKPLNVLLRKLDDMRETGEYAINKFKEDFDKQPWYAFEWSRQAFEGAGRCKVAKHVKEGLATDHMAEKSEDERVRLIHEHALDVIKRAARNCTSLSTSGQSNLMEQATLAAWAELEQKLSEIKLYADR